MLKFQLQLHTCDKISTPACGVLFLDTTDRYFLAHGYAVIFLHRANSLKPFQRHFSKENPLDWFTLMNQHGGSEDEQQLKRKFCRD